MTTESETKLARYKTIEKEADAWGRVIGVRRLKPSEKTKLTGLIDGHPELNEFKHTRISH